MSCSDFLSGSQLKLQNSPIWNILMVASTDPRNSY
jgi:hypothetical protein